MTLLLVSLSSSWLRSSPVGVGRRAPPGNVWGGGRSKGGSSQTCANPTPGACTMILINQCDFDIRVCYTSLFSHSDHGSGITRDATCGNGPLRCEDG
jgi:hypothetical protein